LLRLSGRILQAQSFQESAMGRRVIGRDRTGAASRLPAAPRLAALGFGMAAKLNWQRGRRRGFSAHRSYRLTGLGTAIGGQRQRRLRAARSN
jgi:hypothetical protein